MRYFDVFLCKCVEIQSQFDALLVASGFSSVNFRRLTK